MTRAQGTVTASEPLWWGCRQWLDLRARSEVERTDMDSEGGERAKAASWILAGVSGVACMCGHCTLD